MRSKCRHNLTRAAFALAAAVLLAPVIAGGDPIDYGGYRPHYQGFGVTSVGGRGGIVNKVTNLSDFGPGSFRTAVAPRAGCVNTPATCARFVVFETSGTIALGSDIRISSPYLTIAGQTAPSPGISIRNRSIFIDTHDVVIQHTRFRHGDTGSGQHFIYIAQNAAAFNVVLDHISVAWGRDASISLRGTLGGRDVAVLDSLIAEPLCESTGTAQVNCQSHEGLLLFGGTAGTMTIARNLHVHATHRTPWIAVGFQVSHYNNVAYNNKGNAGDADGYYSFLTLFGTDPNYPAAPLKVVSIGNLAIAGPNTHPDMRSVKITLRSDQVPSQVYLSDNTGPRMTLGNQVGGVTFQGAANAGNSIITAPPSWHTAFNYAIKPNAEVLAYVLANAGARPSDRDPVDARVVADVTQRDGAIINSQNQVGDFPTLAVNTRTYNIPANPNNPGTCGTTTGGGARTIIECDLEAKARALEPATGSAVVPSPPSAAVPSPPRNPRVVQ